MRNHPGTLFIFTLFFLTSCMYGLNYDRTLPAELVISGPEKEIYLLSLHDTTTLNINQEKKEKVFIDAYLHLIESLQESFSEELDSRLYAPLEAIENNDPGFETRKAGDALLMQLSSALKMQRHVNRDSLVKIFFQQSEVPYLLILESFGLTRSQYTEKTENDDGSVSKTAYYDLNGSAYFSLYRFPGRYINITRIEESIHLDDRMVISGLLAVGPSVGNYGKEANLLAEQISEAYIAYYKPLDEKIFRYYYANGELASIDNFMKKHAWNDAILAMEEMIPGANKGMYKKIAHNMSVAYEALGEYDEADRWMAESK